MMSSARAPHEYISSRKEDSLDNTIALDRRMVPKGRPSATVSFPPFGKWCRLLSDGRKVVDLFLLSRKSVVRPKS